MAAGYPGRDLRGSFGYDVQYPYHNQQQRSDGGGNGLLKRSLTELERQQQLHNALFLRSVKQRAHLNSPMSPLSPIDLSNSSTSSSISSTSGINFLKAQQHQQISRPLDFSFATPAKSGIQNQLQELERQLLLDDEDEGDADVSVTCASAAATSEWSEAMHLISPPPPPPPPPQQPQIPLSSSPTTSSSSSSSSAASCSPNPPTPSRQLLIETAAAIAEGNLDLATANIPALKRSANPRGDPNQRLTAMMLWALVSKINSPPASMTSSIADLCSLEHQTSTQMLYDASPCFKLALSAANLAILDATKGQSKIHIVDFDLGQGGQYVSLINAIAEQSRHRSSSLQAPPNLKITAVCDPSFPLNTISNLKVIGEKITRLAERFGVTVRFSVLNRRTTELDRAAFSCEPNEALAVNFAFVLSRIADESVSPANPRDELLRRVKTLEPSVVTLVEQEMNANTAPFAARFSEACSYYGSVLDSLDASCNRDNPDRVRVESGLTRKAANLIAREGADRVERPEVLGKWRARMSMAGFRPVKFGPAVIEPVKSSFGSMKSNPGFTYKEEGSGLGFGWMGRVLVVASTWR